MSVKPLTVDNPSFALAASARDCPPLQFVREFTVNALEAIEERKRRDLPTPVPAQIVWREFVELEDRLSAPKLACVDTGIGMTPEELERYINSLTSTSKRQALDANYGMGAKIAGAVGNSAGLTYLSWTGGEDLGFTCTLAFDAASGQWGLQEDPRTLEVILAVQADLCPAELRKAGWRGTVVVFHGLSSDHDTTKPPSDELGVDWIERAVNTRFYELPGDVEVRCQRAGERATRRARGQCLLLSEHTMKQGRKRINGATVHWRILNTDHERRRKQNSRWAATGHRAALHRGELYDLITAGAGGYRKLQEFGILFGYERAVLYVEPDDALPDTVRAHLVTRGSGESRDLPWEAWADEFAADLPPALRELVEQSAAKSATRTRRDIMKRLEELAVDMPLARYQASPIGDLQGGSMTHGGGGDGGSGSAGEGEAGQSPGSSLDGNVVTLFTRQEGPPVVKSKTSRIPEIKAVWVSEADGTRTPPILEDRGATFLPRQGIVQLSADFRGYRTLRSYFVSRYAHVPGSEPVVDAEIRQACEDQVIEYIIGVLRLRCQPHWTTAAEDHALDDRGLTGCLMQHATLASRIDERLARRLRKAV